MVSRRRNNPPRNTPRPASPKGGVGSTTPRPTRRASAAKTNRPEDPQPPVVTSESRRAMIAESAYLRAERRGFSPGFEVEDWLTAEREVDALLSAGHSGRQ